MNEPILEKFYAMIERADNLPPFLYNVVSKEKIDLFLNETVPDITKEEIDAIATYLPPSLKKEIDKLTLSVIYEIDFNVAMLTTSDQVKRYLHHLYEYLNVAIDKINYNSCSAEIEQRFRKICDLGLLFKMQNDESYVNKIFEPDEWKPAYLNVELSHKEKNAYYFFIYLLSDIDFFEHEYHMILTHIEQLQIDNGFISDPYKDVNVRDNETKRYPHTINEIFYNESNAEPCLSILMNLDEPFIDADWNYIGKNKGIFPLWIKEMKRHSPKPLVKHFPDFVYKDLLNSKIKGLNLSKDASEFRKDYKRLEINKIGIQIKTILSQLSQSGKLGK